MKPTTKIIISIIILTTGIVLGLMLRTRSSESSLQPPITNSPPVQTSYETKENEGGNVTVSVTPLSLKPGLPASFAMAFETHSVDLTFDVTKVTTLTDSMGTTYTPLWEGSPPGGHHRSGTLRFTPDLTKPTTVILTVINVAGIPKRTFSWEVKSP